MDSDLVRLLKKILPFLIVVSLVFWISMIISRKNTVSNRVTTSTKADEKTGHDELSLLTNRLYQLIDASDKSTNDRDRAELYANIGPVAQSRREFLLKQLQQDPYTFADFLSQQQLRNSPSSNTLIDLQNQGLIEKNMILVGKISRATGPHDIDVTYTLASADQPGIYYVIYTDHPLASALMNKSVVVKGWMLDKAVYSNSADITLK